MNRRLTECTIIQAVAAFVLLLDWLSHHHLFLSVFTVVAEAAARPFPGPWAEFVLWSVFWWGTLCAMNGIGDYGWKTLAAEKLWEAKGKTISEAWDARLGWVAFIQGMTALVVFMDWLGQVETPGEIRNIIWLIPTVIYAYALLAISSSRPEGP